MITITKIVDGAAEAVLLEMFGDEAGVQNYYEKVLNGSILHIVKSHLNARIQEEVEGDADSTKIKAHVAAIKEVEALMTDEP